MSDMPGEPQNERSDLATKHDLQAAIAPLATRHEMHEAIAAAVAPLATKAELQAAIAPLATKAELQAAIAPLATKRELELWGGALMERMLDELGRLIRSAQEETRTWIATLDDKYRDLPGRVARLEAER